MNPLSATSASLALPAGFDYQPSTRVVFGAGSIRRLGELATQLGCHRPLVVTDPGLRAAGHPQRALSSLQEAGLEPYLFDGAEENPTEATVRAALGHARQHRADLLVAVGGGSSMDCAKGVNFLFTNDGTMADYRGFGKATRPMLPSIAIPTTAGTGSEAQSYALIADERTHMKMACGDPKAAFRVAILDPEVTVSQPSRVTAVTGIDALAHAIESMVTTRRTWLSRAFSREAWRLLAPNFERVLSAPGDVSARAAMQLGAHFAGAAIENAMLGAAHACANPLTAHYGVTHGIAVGIMLPAVIRYNLSTVAPLYEDLAVGAVSGGEGIARLVEELMQRAGLPTRLASCDVERAALAKMAKEAGEQWTVRFNPRPAGEKDLLGLYETVY